MKVSMEVLLEINELNGSFILFQMGLYLFSCSIYVSQLLKVSKVKILLFRTSITSARIFSSRIWVPWILWSIV